MTSFADPLTILRCSECDYQLDADRHDGRCPECGMPIAASRRIRGELATIVVPRVHWLCAATAVAALGWILCMGLVVVGATTQFQFASEMRQIERLAAILGLIHGAGLVAAGFIVTSLLASSGRDGPALGMGLATMVLVVLGALVVAAVADLPGARRSIGDSIAPLLLGARAIVLASVGACLAASMRRAYRDLATRRMLVWAAWLVPLCLWSILGFIGLLHGVLDLISDALLPVTGIVTIVCDTVALCALAVIALTVMQARRARWPTDTASRAA